MVAGRRNINNYSWKKLIYELDYLKVGNKFNGIWRCKKKWDEIKQEKKDERKSTFPTYKFETYGLEHLYLPISQPDIGKPDEKHPTYITTVVIKVWACGWNLYKVISNISENLDSNLNNNELNSESVSFYGFLLSITEKQPRIWVIYTDFYSVNYLEY